MSRRPLSSLLLLALFLLGTGAGTVATPCERGHHAGQPVGHHPTPPEPVVPSDPDTPSGQGCDHHGQDSRTQGPSECAWAVGCSPPSALSPAQVMAQFGGAVEVTNLGTARTVILRATAPALPPPRV